MSGVAESINRASWTAVSPSGVFKAFALASSAITAPQIDGTSAASGCGRAVATFGGAGAAGVAATRPAREPRLRHRGEQ